MINISEDDARLFEQNGFTKEQVGATINHYREQGLSDDDIQARMNSKISEFRGATNEPEQQEAIKGGVQFNVTPSGIFKGSQDVVGSAIMAPVTAKRDNIGVVDAYKKNIDKVKKYRQDNPTPVQDFLVDTATYSLIPQSKLAGIPGFVSNVARYGALPGLLEGLKQGEAGKGALTGSAVAGGLLAGMPVVGNVARGISAISKKTPELLGAIAQLEPETVAQAIKPGSKALDYTKKGVKAKEGQIIENIRDNYNQILSERGNQVGNLLSELPNDKTYKAEQLLNNYDAILNNYSLSKNPALNPARNATQRELGKIEDMLGGYMPDIAKGQNQVNPKELYDINKNISNMIDWDKPGAALKNDVLEQIYLANAKKISDLSPELAQANKAYSDLMDFKKSEGIRAILNPNNTDNAISKLKNYDTMSSVKKAENIKELEKLMVDNGYQPFLSDIDDIVAAQDLLKKDYTGLGSLTGIAKAVLTRPALRGIRAYNSSDIPALLQNLGNKFNGVGDVARRVIPASIISGYGQ